MLLLLLATSDAFANSAGKTGSSTLGCRDCHGRSASAATTATFAAADTVVAPGDRVTVTFTVTNSGGATAGGGLNVSATGGTLAAGSNTRASAGEITHSATTSMASGSVTFDFAWTAPASEGTYTLRGAGNAVNGNRSDTGDAWALASNLTITVDDGCDDLDGDGYEWCEDGSGLDCDDTTSTISPRASETCDGVDQDCDGTVDESPTDGTAYWRDADGDGFGGGASVRSCEALDGYVTTDGDCDDTDGAVSPDADEVCNGDDDDCDGVTDGAAALDASTYYRDADGDGHGWASTTTRDCSVPAGYVTDTTDCDDTRVTRSPSNVEVCDAADVDEDCDSLADDADPSVTATSTWFADGDGDGYGGAATTQACAVPIGYAAIAGDCDDGDTSFHPGAAETCDLDVDYNCDGATGFDDADRDGFAACEDCDDGDATVRPGATETCDGEDDDCDGTVDEADAADALTWYVDADGDGWGTAGETTLACAAPAGFSSTDADCDDTSADVRPDAPEVWYDDVDQDCDGNDDDQDADGFLAGEDCDDTRADVFPGAVDAWYDGVDADCAGNSDHDADADGQDSASHGGTDCDDADATVYLGAPDEPYDGVVTDCVDADEYDVDGDGFAHDVDCDDASSAIHPDAAEIWYDGVDQDCDTNDTDQDGDGVAVDADCDDTDGGVQECDTGGETGIGDTDTGAPAEDTGGSGQDKVKEGCGCDSTPGTTGLALGLLALGAVARRRR